jgi:hypothetical protein
MGEGVLFHRKACGKSPLRSKAGTSGWSAGFLTGVTCYPPAPFVAAVVLEVHGCSGGSCSTASGRPAGLILQPQFPASSPAPYQYGKLLITANSQGAGQGGRGDGLHSDRREQGLGRAGASGAGRSRAGPLMLRRGRSMSSLVSPAPGYLALSAAHCIGAQPNLRTTSCEAGTAAVDCRGLEAHNDKRVGALGPLHAESRHGVEPPRPAACRATP